MLTTEPTLPAVTALEVAVKKCPVRVILAFCYRQKKPEVTCYMFFKSTLTYTVGFQPFFSPKKLTFTRDGRPKWPRFVIVVAHICRLHVGSVVQVSNCEKIKKWTRNLKKRNIILVLIWLQFCVLSPYMDFLLRPGDTRKLLVLFALSQVQHTNSNLVALSQKKKKEEWNRIYFQMLNFFINLFF